jgi:hypothetical protein
MTTLEQKQAAMRAKHRHQVHRIRSRKEPLARHEVQRLKAKFLLEEEARSAADVAELLGAHPAAVEEWVRRGCPIRGDIIRKGEDFS